MSITFGDHLIDSGHYDITSEQERERDIDHLRQLNKDAHAIIDRIWDVFGRPSYEDLAGRTIYDLVEAAAKDAARYQYLKNHCSSHYPMTHEQPAEWSIGWEFQQSTPLEAYGSFDKWIDADIEANRQASAEDEASTLPTHPQTTR